MTPEPTEYAVPLLLLGNVSYSLLTLCYFFRDILWLRFFTILGLCAILPYHYFQASPAWTPLIWSSVWLGTNFVMTCILVNERRAVRLAPLEQRIYDRVFSSIHPREFLKIVRLAVHKTAPTGSELVRTDTDTSNLYLVTDGWARVERSTGPQVTLGAYEFIGEQSYLTAEKTSATVIVDSEPFAYLEWDKTVLKEALARNQILESAFHLIMTGDVIHKLHRM